MGQACPINFPISRNFDEIVFSSFAQGPEGLSPRATRYFWWLVAMAKTGRWIVSGYCAAIAAAVYRVQGQTRSVRTLRAALRELEAGGWISVRPGRRGIAITLNRDRFSWWCQASFGNVTPIPTSPTKTDTRQLLPPSDRTNIPTSDFSVLTKISNKPLDKSKKRANYTNWIHPILFTIRCLLRGAPDRFGLEVLAKTEIAGETSCTDVPWPRYAAEWQRMPIVEREGIARSWFLPALRAVTGSSPSSPAPRPAPSSPAPSSLTPEDLRILTAAAERVRKLRVWGDY